MNPRTRQTRLLVRLLAAVAVVAAASGVAAERAQADYSAKAARGTLRFDGNAATDKLALRLQAGVPQTLQVDVGDDGSAEFSFDRKTFDRIVVEAGGGDDLVRIDEANGVFTTEEETILRGDGGNDTLLGGSGAESIAGGNGDDTVDGNRGNDFDLRGAGGDDTFIWDPGDGSDTIDSGSGTDTMLFNGNVAPEQFELSANGSATRLFRNVGNITMQLQDVERVDLETLGGADSVTAGDLSPTPTRLLNVDLEGVAGGGAGDAEQDRVVVQGTEGADKVQVGPVSGEVHVTGLAAEVRIAHPEAANDTVVVETFGGNDEVTGSNGLAVLIRGLTVDTGAGNDTIFGADTRDVLISGEGNDLVDGNRADDVAFLGSEDDTFVWDPGDGNDTLEGQAGTDTMLFNGNGAPEAIDVAANGGRVRFFRNVASITMDLDDIERIDFEARGGADTVTVNDLSGTDLTVANLDLEGTTADAGDGEPDTVVVNATNGDDVATVAGSGSAVSVFGLPTHVNVAHPEAANDRLTMNMLAGDDVLEASGLPAGLIQLVGNGGDGDDVLLGSAGPDVLSGDAGDDVLLGGPGVDVLDGGPGNNIVIQD